MKFLLAVFFLTSLPLSAENVELTFEFNGLQRELAVHIPDDYNSGKDYELLIGIHGCGQDAYSYRTALTQVANNNNMILMCINALDDGTQLNKMMVDERGNVIPASIEYISKTYSIDKQSVYLTGFSCNGAMTLFHGLNNLYNFKGLIPFNAYLPPEYDGRYNLESKIPTCFSSGTNDGNYNRNQALYNQLKSKGGISFFNSMPNIGHTVSFPGFTDEMQECIDFINQTTTDIETEDSGELLYPNPNNGILNIRTNSQLNNAEIFNLLGEKLIATKKEKIDISQLQKGVYFVTVSNSEYTISQKLIVN